VYNSREGVLKNRKSKIVNNSVNTLLHINRTSVNTKPKTKYTQGLSAMCRLIIG